MVGKKIEKPSKKQITKIRNDFLSNLQFFKDEIKPAGQIPAAVLESKSKSFDFFNFFFKML